LQFDAILSHVLANLMACKGGPLSRSMTVGMPCVANIQSNLGIIALEEVE